MPENNASLRQQAACVVLINDRLYGYGLTSEAAMRDFQSQIAGADPLTKLSMTTRSKLVSLDADQASEVAEMITAEALSWE